MKTETNELLTFHLTGRRPEEAGNDPAAFELCPALLSRYRDLASIRHDYPLVLVDGGAKPAVRSLAEIVNSVLQAIAPRGIEGERLRRNVLSLEREIRALTFEGMSRSLSATWSEAFDSLISKTRLSAEEEEAFSKNIERARKALGCDGQVVSCNEETPSLVIRHAWRMIQAKRAQGVRKELREIVVKLSGILDSDHARSNDARRPEALKAAVGSSFEDEFDFDAMSKSLPKVKAKDLLPKKRRERIEAAISVLESQKFFRVPGDERAHCFEVKNCTEALDQFRKRLPEMVDFQKAIAVAELELANAYREEKHDRFFERFNEESLTREEIALFPSYLVCMKEGDYDAANKAALIDILSSDLPIKVLVQPREVFSSSPVANGGGACSGWSLGLANMAVGLQSAFVLKTTSANLRQVGEKLSEGLECGGPALFSVYSGTDSNESGLPAYLISASATESRAFPTLVYDPRNGEDWESRFSVEANPQPERIWPVNEFCYQDEDAQGVSEEIAFTLVDHLATDRRFAGNFMSVPRSRWSQEMVPLGDYLQDGVGASDGKVPYILMVGEREILHRVVVEKSVVDAAMRYAKSWRNLQELGGIDNSYVRKRLAEERRIWDEEKQREIEALVRQPGKEGAEEAARAPVAEEPTAEAEAAEQVEAISPDVAYIETARCSTCNECTNRNGKMFKYNENKQAYIADLQAGTYRELVEAAEVCKLAIIHPGKPWNPDEPNLEELTQRAAPFI